MTSEGKESLCQLMASLLSPPDQGLAKLIHQGVLYSFFHQYILSREEDVPLLKEFLVGEEPEVILKDLRNAYERLFSGLRAEGVSLIESYYKPWTVDPQCPLPFASDKGLLMGDSALHLLALYEECGLEISDEFMGCPDHLIIELEFLAHLYRWAGDSEVKRFIEDHLDWISLIENEFNPVDRHPFYSSILRILVLFLEKERERLKGMDHGETNVH